MNRHWIMMFVTGIINITFAVVRGSAGLYYLQRYLKWNEGQIFWYFLISGVAMIFGAMMTRFAVKAIGKKWSFITSLALVALTAIPFYLIRPDLTTLVVNRELFGHWIQLDQTTLLVMAFQVVGMMVAGKSTFRLRSDRATRLMASWLSATAMTRIGGIRAARGWRGNGRLEKRLPA